MSDRLKPYSRDLPPNPGVFPVGSLASGELFPPSYFTSTRSYQRGETIYQDGDPARYLHIVRSGLAREMMTSEQGEEYIVGFSNDRYPRLMGHEVFGDERIYHTRAEAITPVVAQRIDVEDVRKVMWHHPKYTESLMVRLSTMVRERTESHAEMVFLDLQGRLASNLISIANLLSGYPTDQRDLWIRGLTQNDLAAAIGATRASVNKLLMFYEDKGWIEREGRAFKIVNPHAIMNVGANLAPMTEPAGMDYLQSAGERKTA